jgi:hypothetical protein
MAYGSSQAIELDACHGIEPALSSILHESIECVELDACHGIEPALSSILHESIECGPPISRPTDRDVEVLLANLQPSRFSVVS